MVLLARQGWAEHFLLWELPLERAHAYAHAALRMKNIKTIRPGQNAFVKEFDRVLQHPSES